MSESSALGFALTYAATLGVGVLMFFGQVIAFTALLVLAGTVSLLARSERVMTRRRTR
ncbi:hypothetical protein [Arthrobacter sp. ISL-72]|uniref:hypothetical protein n=1 Tax=Arthrobacter sp. ISL-72 TaxID=2819114 RepID=UPI001BE6CEEF|nr:hypothetical protein [Arthrobacter sp. ISL-72]MBT2597965.1 hypothetical protein [Arthrobacter sp. ISL-72]